MSDDDRINWNVDLEVSLFHAIHAHRPVGVNRHFQMVFLHDKLNSAVDKKISAKEIWNHLTEMYDLNALNDSDVIPFPNTATEFSITEAVGSELIEKPFPRNTLSDDSKLGSESVKRKETVKEATPAAAADSSSLKESLDAGSGQSRGSKLSATEAATSDASKTSSAGDSSKSDSRKRTRHSLQSPAVSEAGPAGVATPTSTSTPSSAKRSRRI